DFKDAVAEDDDYILWAYVSHREATVLDSVTKGIEIQGVIQSRTANWHPVLRQMIAETEPETIQSFAFSASARVEPWRTTNVTLLGDAIHNMPPVGGMGGNAALHDASLLCSAIASAQTGSAMLTSSLHEYEAAMIKHGFAAVRATLLY